MNLLDPEILNILFGLVGAVAGWWMRKLGVPPGGLPTPAVPVPVPVPTIPTPSNDLTEALRLLLERQCKQQTQTLLNQLLAEGKEKNG